MTLSYNDLLLENEALRDMIRQLQNDCTFQVLNKNGLMALHSDIEDGKDLIFIDLCNVHSANHKFTMAGYDELVNNALVDFRHSDIWAKIGGDEFVVILNSGNVVDFIDRLNAAMRLNNVYAVFAAVKTHGGLKNSIDAADMLVSEVKLSLELNGMKPSRSEEYKCLESHIIIAE